MKNICALVGVVIRVAAIAAMWIWTYSLPSNSGSLGYIVIALHALALTVILLIGAVVRLIDFFWVLKHEDEAAVQKKNPLKTSVIIAVQAVLIIAETIYLCEYIVGFRDGIWVLIVFVILKLVDIKTIRRT